MARDALRPMLVPMADGDHFDYGRPSRNRFTQRRPSTRSPARELHFKTGKDWRDYNEKYGAATMRRTPWCRRWRRPRAASPDEGVRHSAAEAFRTRQAH